MELLLPPLMEFRWIILGFTACNVVICVLLELNQTEEGINVPEALKPFMPPSK